MSVQDWGGFLLSCAIFGLLIACLTNDPPAKWLRKDKDV